MKFVSVLPLATIASAIVLPDINDVQTWRDVVPSRDSFDDALSHLKGNIDDFASGFEDALSHATDAVRTNFDELLGDAAAYVDLSGKSHPKKPKTSNLTIYETIKESPYTTKFAALVDEHESIVEILNSTKANYTLFVPTDEAFEHIPHDKKPSKEFVEAILKYHIGEGLYPAGRILATHTIPTTLDEDWLGGQPQRLRSRVGLFGVKLNFYDKVIYVDYPAKNGVIHAVKHILVPPPMVGRELALFPSKFSTLLLAYEKTDFVSFIHHVKMKGSTVFAPSNAAWERLGPAANAYLFNTQDGLKHLRALLKYHIVANETLYSDAYYRKSGSEGEASPLDDNADAEGIKHYHVDLPSLLDEKNIAVDVSRWGGFIDIKVNGYVHVAVQDGVARNGVIHVVDKVLIPQRTPPSDSDIEEQLWGSEVSVDELKARLAPFVEEEEEEQFSLEL